MASFGSVSKSMDCANALQRAFASHSDSMPEPLHVRIGLNAGEPIAEGDPEGHIDLFGTSVNLAASGRGPLKSLPLKPAPGSIVRAPPRRAGSLGPA